MNTSLAVCMNGLIFLITMWISTDSYEQDKESIMPYLTEATQGYKEVVWTCANPSDHSKFLGLCEEHWTYVRVDQMDGTEAPCLVIYGIPVQDHAQPFAKLGRLFSRARNSVVIITEDEVTR